MLTLRGGNHLPAEHKQLLPFLSIPVFLNMCAIYTIVKMYLEFVISRCLCPLSNMSS